MRDLKEYKKLDYEIIRHGTPIVLDSWILAESGGIMLCQLDVSVKHCLVGVFSNSDNKFGVSIYPSGTQLPVLVAWSVATAQDSDKKYISTDVALNYDGYEIFCCESDRYAVKIVLQKTE